MKILTEGKILSVNRFSMFLLLIIRYFFLYKAPSNRFTIKIFWTHKRHL